MQSNNQTPEEETFRKLKREPDFEKVEQALKDAHLKALEEMGWTMQEWIEERNRRQELVLQELQEFNKATNLEASRLLEERLLLDEALAKRPLWRRLWEQL